MIVTQCDHIPEARIGACVGAHVGLFLFRVGSAMVRIRSVRLLVGYIGLSLPQFLNRGLLFSTNAPRGDGWGQASYTFPLRITCKKGVGGSR